MISEELSAEFSTDAASMAVEPNRVVDPLTGLPFFPDRYEALEAERDAFRAEREVRVTALNAALMSHGSVSDERHILKAANAYYDFLTGKPDEPTRQ